MQDTTKKVHKDTTMMIKIDSETKEKARLKADRNGLNLSQVMRKLLTDYANDTQGRLMF